LFGVVGVIDQTDGGQSIQDPVADVVGVPAFRQLAG
jgi:hypothetical protein